jgi:hypothetical protein
LTFPSRPLGPPPPFFFLLHPLLPCSAPSAAGAVQLPWPPPCCRHRSTSCLGGLHASLSPCPGRVFSPRCLVSRAPQPPEPLPAATSSPPRSALTTTSLPSPFCSAASAAHTQSVSISFTLPCAPRTPDQHCRPLLLSGELRAAVDSRRRPPIAPPTLLQASPTPAHAHQPLNAIEFLPEHHCRRPPLAATPCSLWSTPSRPPSTPIDPTSGFPTPP